MTWQGADEVDRVFGSVAARAHVPGIAYGVILHGELVHAGGVGTLVVGEDAPPDAASVFRIASMTKSFTGAAVLLLHDEGRLRLDEPAAAYAPELAGWRGPTADSPTLTVRHLLSMESGLPTDDAWADRHLDADRGEMDAIVASGATFAWAPGTAFEYSNLGWALVGRIVERVAGMSPQQLVQERLLTPLGMTSTGWTRESLPDRARIAAGHRWQDDVWLGEPEPLGDGGLAPMGGLWSTVGDLARWVAFFLEAFPPRDEPDLAPLSRAARREMQQLRRVEGVAPISLRPGGPERLLTSGYGIGIAVTLDHRLGTIVGHSGGLPGFGSHMRWLPDRGIGVVALGNVTYAPMGAACLEALERLADADALPRARALTPSPALADAAARVRGLLDAWEDDAAAALFADNVLLDEDAAHRGNAIDDLRRRVGSFGQDGALEAETPLRGAFGVADGRVRVEVGLDAQVPPRVQWFELEVDAPIVTDPAYLELARGTAYVVARPTGPLAAWFDALQAGTVARLEGHAVAVPAAHATLKSFGAQASPLRQDDLAPIAEVVRAWAAETPALRFTVDGLDAFDEEQVPIVRLRATDELRTAIGALRARAESAGLPPGYADVWGPDEWILHLSLAYPREIPGDRWEELAAWLRGLPSEEVTCLVEAVDLVAFDGGPERWIGRHRLEG